MATDKKDIVTYVAFEGEMTRLERIIHRLWIMCLALLVALLATNIGWIIYESQFEYYTETIQEVSQDASDGGTNNFIGGDYNGKTEDDNDN